VASDDNSGGVPYSSALTFTAVSNTTYQIAVDGWYNAVGLVALNLRPAPSNDNFADRVSILGSSVTTNGYNLGATSEPGEPNAGGLSSGKSVWWSWTTTTNWSVSLDASGSSFDTVVAVYTGTSVSNLSLVKANYGYYEGSVRFPAVAGGAYQIAVSAS